MKHSNLLAISLITLIALNGCNTTNENQKETQSTTISGTTTLSKGFVCVDENADTTCNNDETQVQAGDKGDYTLEYPGELADGVNLIAEDGYNLVLESDNSDLTFKAAYNSQKSEQNINTMSTLIANAVASGSSYNDAKAHIATKYGVDVDNVETDPITEVQEQESPVLFLTTRAIENGVVHHAHMFRDTNDTNDSNGSGVITEDDADDALFGVDIFDFDLDAFIERLTEYFNYLVNLLVCTYNGSCDSNLSEDFNITKDLSETLVERDALNGFWYMSEGSTPRTCVEVDAQDNYTNHNVDSIYALNLVYTPEERKLALSKDSVLNVTYTTYKSETKEDTMYFTNTVSEEYYILTSQESLESCKTTLDNALEAAKYTTVVFGSDGFSDYLITSTTDKSVATAGEKDPTLNLVVGTQYKFTVTNPNLHPMELVSETGTVLLAMNAHGTLNDDEAINFKNDNKGSITFTYTEALATELSAYRCDYHSPMTGSISNTSVSQE